MKKCYGMAAVITLLFTALDLGTKEWINRIFRLGESKTIIPGFFDLTLVYNRGAAFGQGATMPMWFFIVTSIVAIGVVTYIFIKSEAHENLTRLGLVLILSGAIGNLVDRIRYGYVVDFLDVYIGKHHWPAFNIADSAITVGAVLFAIELLFLSKKSS